MAAVSAGHLLREREMASRSIHFGPARGVKRFSRMGKRTTGVPPGKVFHTWVGVLAASSSQIFRCARKTYIQGSGCTVSCLLEQQTRDRENGPFLCRPWWVFFYRASQIT